MAPPCPPFTLETALQKVKMAENGWNSQNPAKIALAYTEDSEWRNRTEHIRGRPAIINFLTRKWEKEHEYRLEKYLWAYMHCRIAVHFQYEYRNASGQWYRCYGNENWEFGDNGEMQRRVMLGNDVKIEEADRKFRWDYAERAAIPLAEREFSYAGGHEAFY